METILRDNTQSTSASVLMINAQGMLISVRGEEYFVSYARVPWLRKASIVSALNVCVSGRDSIEWPDLDIDLEVDSLRHPERYPLIMRRTPTEVLA